MGRAVVAAKSAPVSRSERYRRVMEALIIRDEHGRLVPMRFSTSQKVLWSYVAPQLDTGGRLRFIVVKGRQVYSTTFFESLTFVRTSEQSNTNSLVIAHDLHSASEIFGIAKRFYDYLPLPKLKPSRMREIEFAFPNGASRFKVVSAGKIAKGRGTTQTCVHASEVAYWPQPEVLIGLFQAVPDLDDTLWVLESTANGMAGVGRAFYDEWKAAVDGRSDLTPVFVPWFVMPKYRKTPCLPESDWDDEEKLLVEQFGQYGVDGESLAWRRFAIETKLQGSTDLFHQEYPSTPEEAFLASGLPAFEMRAVLAQQKNIRAPQAVGLLDKSKWIPSRRGWVQVWRHPEPDHTYVIGVDTSEGLKGGDYACGQVMDMATLEQVAVVHGLIPPWDMAEQLAQLGKWYNTALVAVEVQGSGRAVQDYLIRRFSYPNLHLWQGRTDRIRPGPAQLFGWETTVQSRPLLIEAGRRAINGLQVVIHDRSTLEEISKFSRTDSGKYEAEAGHDDRVLALLIALRSREENYAPAKKLILSPEYTLSDSAFPPGVRVIHAADPGVYPHRHKVHQELSRRARSAAKNWMAL